MTQKNICIRVFYVIFLLFYFHTARSQDIKKLDSITEDVIDDVYTEVPKQRFKKKESDSLSRFSFNAFPYIFSSPETKLAFGGGGIMILYAGKGLDLRPSKVEFGGYYSVNNQYRININPQFFFFDNKLYVEMPTSYGFFVNRYWGRGDSTPDYDDAEYAIETFDITLSTQVPPLLFSADRTGLILSYEDSKVVDKRSNELLMNDSLPGSNGAKLFGIGLNLVWDSRDNLFYPNSGRYQSIKILAYPEPSDYVYSMVEFDTRAYKAFSEDRVLAVNLYVQTLLGDTPFFKLPALGGKNRMRGYFNGRYVDNFYGMLQAEYRQYFWKRFGFVAFAGMGNVSNTILDYRFDTMKYSFGGGLRYLINKKQKVNLRMDIGITGDGSTGIYFGIQEAF